MGTQPLTNIVNVTVQVSPIAAVATALNLGLIVGPSAVINNVTRTSLFSGTAGMLAAGFTALDPEYAAAELYFSQFPAPTNVVIGRQGTAQTTLETALTSGTAYTSLSVAALTGAIAAGDTLTIGTGSTTQTVTSSAAAAAGATTIAVVSFTANAAYAIGTAVSNAESILTAVTACRASNTNWYACYACGAADADVEAVAPYIQSATPVSVFFYDTQDAAVLAGTTPNVMSILQADGYSRTWGQYSTTAHAAAAAMGIAMGLNTGLANSAYTLAYKSEVGVTPEVLTTPQVTAITGWNGNVYTSYGGQYNLLVQGDTANGTPFDQVLNLDILTVSIQTAVMNALTESPKIPQTDAGVSILVNDISAVCAQAATQGILAPGVWNAAPVLGLQTGAALSTGYVILAATIASQTAAQISARQAPLIYACVLLAGAIEHVAIGVVVDS